MVKPMKLQVDANIFNPVYFPYLHTNYRYEIYYGGAGSGKSYFVAQKKLLQSFEAKHKVLIIRKVAGTSRNSTFSLFKTLIYKYGLDKYFKIQTGILYIQNLLTGSEFIFSGLDDAEKLKSIEGITDIWVEEATEITRSDFLQLDLRLRGITNFKKQIILTFNPISAHHWLKDHFFDKKHDDLLIVKTVYSNNKFIDDDYKRMMEDLKYEDEDYYRVYALGEWGQHKNAIYTNWDVVKSMPENYDARFYGIDFGYNNPSAIVEVRVKDDEYYLKELLYKTHLTNSMLISEMKKLGINGTDEVYCDSAEPDRIEEMQMAGFNTYPAIKNVFDGIDFIKSKKLHIYHESDNLIAEIKDYKWKEKEDMILDEPVKFNDHLMDAMRYAIYTYNRDYGATIEGDKIDILY